jgi:hypothetical protein
LIAIRCVFIITSPQLSTVTNPAGQIRSIEIPHRTSLGLAGPHRTHTSPDFTSPDPYLTGFQFTGSHRTHTSPDFTSPDPYLTGFDFTSPDPYLTVAAAAHRSILGMTLNCIHAVFTFLKSGEVKSGEVWVR